MNPDELLRPQQVAYMLGVTPQALRNWNKAGLLPAERTAGGHYRYRKSEVIKFYLRYKDYYSKH